MEAAQAIACVLVRTHARACIAGSESEISQVSISNPRVETVAFVRGAISRSVSHQRPGLRYLWNMNLFRFLNSKTIN